jgi:hypothetical protein
MSYKVITVGIIMFVLVCSGTYMVMLPATHIEQQNTIVDNSSANVTTETTTPIVVTPTPEPTPSYVTCSDYKRIVDKWKTPLGSYVKFEDNETIVLIPRKAYAPFGGNETYYGDHYDEIQINEYASTGCEEYKGSYVTMCLSSLLSGRSFKLIRVSEKESGYRDACLIV